MKQFVVCGPVWTSERGFVPGTIYLQDGVIAARTAALDPGADLVVPADGYIIPGLIDLQVNGAFGVDLTGDPAAVAQVAAGLPATGVTAFLPTIITSSFAGYPAALRTLAEAARTAGGAAILGVHLEGPYLSPRRPGAHDPRLLRTIDLDEILRWADPALVRIVTLAPELPGGGEAIRALRARGILVSAGHSDATWAEAQAGFAAGLGWGTHLFNAMAPLGHREPGLAGALLGAPFPCGLIADGEHVHPAMVRLAVAARGTAGITLVTDCMAAMGMPAGNYTLAARQVMVDGRTARLPDGTLAGSVLTMGAALRNVVDFAGCSVAAAVTMAAATPAALLGLPGRGRIAANCPADLAVLDAGLHVTHTFVSGELVWQKGSREPSRHEAGQ